MGERSGVRVQAGRADDPQAFTEAVGSAIRRARQARGWTQGELALSAGLSSNYVARLERGEVGVSLFVAQKLCEALDTDLATLIASRSGSRTTRQRAAR